MALKSRTLDTVEILELDGRFDAHTVPSVEEWLDQTSHAPPARVVVDLSGVNFVDSMACATLVRGMKNCRENGGDLRVCALQAPVRIIFELTRLDKAFDIFPDVEAAVRSFAEQARA